MIVFGNGKETTEEMATTETPTTSEPASTEANRIVMGDQFPGNVVFVSSVQLANAGWVEIHADNNGQPGAYIGSQYFDKGINTGKITLTKPTVEGGLYYAMLHSDDGDKKFDPAKDLPLKDAKGNIIMKIFHAAASVGAGLKG
jgi:hypothetical protein